VETWLEALRAGDTDAAWDLFITRYRRLILASIRRSVRDPDDVMDVFADVCASLSADGLARVRRYVDAPSPSARFSTWLVIVVRNQTVDWFRRRDGRPRHRVPENLSLLERRIFEDVIIDGASHEACFQGLRLGDGPRPSAHDFAEALRTTYRVAHGRPGGARPCEPDERRPASPEDESLDSDAARRLARVMATLPPADRLAIQLFVVDELPAAEVARVVGWPHAKTVYNRVSRGLAQLRRALAAEGIGRSDL
jgi:RNA polymerase sigma factor (sigma-70 family)